ncbi:MAG: 50S ribosome-binding GTPase [Proteobacteria bacterium]|nr:50S ribosome-binding GTPase [Pseudomonadota bacterium]
MTPVIAIIGRPNVGKSTLFNALTRTRDALVADFPGLTRDRKYGDIDLDGMHAHLVDTGGMFGEEGLLTDLMDQQIGQAMDESHLVLFVVSARDGLIHDDREILKRIRNQQKPVLLIVNKSEGLIDEIAIADFYQLGIKDMLAISSAHRKGMSNIHEYLCEFVYSHADEFTTP